MDVIFSAIAPTLLLLGGGIALHRRAPLDERFWTGLSWVSYWVFTPSLFITAISSTDLSALSPGPLLLSLAVPITIAATLAIIAGKASRADGPQITSLVQGSIRINTYIGLIFASALHGQAGIATFALASAVVVPLVNVICVSSLAVLGKTGKTKQKNHLLKELITNPLILACMSGLLLNLLDIPIPVFINSTLEILAQPALACGTLIAGAALRFTFRKRDLLDVSIASLLKLAVLPLLAMSIAIPLGVSGATLTSIVLICAVPTSPSAYILALRLGGDTRLIATITGIQTLLSAATMPVMLTIAANWAT